jgi:hypothetical protein
MLNVKLFTTWVKAPLLTPVGSVICEPESRKFAATDTGTGEPTSENRIGVAPNGVPAVVP